LSTSASNSLCPCESGLNRQVCCLTIDGLFKKPSTVKVSARENHSHVGCYANELGYCSKKLSGEHFISDGILREFAQMPIVQGFRWQKNGEEKAIGRASLVSNILCTTHNSALSPFDAELTRFHRAVAAVVLDHKAGRVSEGHVLFSGDDIERAIVKALIGGIASKSMHNGDGLPLQLYDGAHSMCLDFLFNGKTWGDAYSGLYFYPGNESRPMGSNICGLAPMLVEGKVLGVEAYIAGITFLLFLSRPKTFAGKDVDKVWQRPRKIILTVPGTPGKKMLEMSWSMPSSNGWFELGMFP